MELGRSYRRGIRKGLVQDHVQDGHLDDRELPQRSTVRDRGALADEVVHLCFEGYRQPHPAARDFEDLEGATRRHLAARAWDRIGARWSRAACSSTCTAGNITCTTPTSSRLLQSAVHDAAITGGISSSPRLVNERPVSCLRDLLKLKTGVPSDPDRRGRAGRAPSCARFDSAGMSLGALVAGGARVALADGHEPARCGRSNSGEGGEDPIALSRPRRTPRSSRWPPGRFGVTPEYLDQCRGAADQDRAGCQARRGRAASGTQGQRDDRAPALSRGRASA